MNDFPGARWWRCDFHNHTPASDDYRGDRSRSDREWLLDYMRAGIDCVAITDHNCGDRIDSLRAALVALETEQPSDPSFRPLTLFPGVEITTAEGLHLLAIFDVAEPADTITRVLIRIDCPKWGKNHERQCGKSALDTIEAVGREGGLVIAAHIDRKNGLYESQPTTSARGDLVYKVRTKPRTLAAVLAKIDAVQVVDEAGPAIADHIPALRKRLAILAGSDAHKPDEVGSASSWVKMSQPSLRALRMALLDHSGKDDDEGSVSRHDPSNPDRNKLPALWLGELNASNLVLRQNPSAGPLSVQFNPWFNAIIGGRGSGKSSIVELLRIALRRDAELRTAADGPLRQVAETFERFAKVADAKGSGALLVASRLELALFKDDTQLRVRWAQTGGLQAVEELSASTWSAVPEPISDDYVRARFPATILSQKQIFALAEQRGFLLELIDRAPDVDRDTWARRYEEARQRFFSLRAQARQLMPDLSNRPNVEAELRETERKLTALELSQHADSLKQYQRARQQLSAQQNLIQQWQRDLKALQDAAAEPDLFMRVQFEGFDPAEAAEAQFLAAVDQLEESMRAEYLQIQQGIARLQGTIDGVQASFEALPLQARIARAQEAYAALLESLRAQGVDSPDQYAGLVARKQDLQTQLKRLGERLEEQREYEANAESALAGLVALRREITERRTRFIGAINEGAGERIRLSIKPYGSAKDAEVRFRELIKQPSAFASDILETVDGGVQRGVLSRLYADGATDVEEELGTLKQEVLAIRREPQRQTDLLGEAIHGKLRQHIETKLSDRDIDELLAWFPDDGLDLSFHQQGSWRHVDGASAGQKTAAVLALLLSFGDEPLIVDQPEDDLDNAMVMELVVGQIRRNKSRRQLIIVTHNPNVVVNGDAEWVIPMQFRKGQIEADAQGVGSVAERGTRNAICAIMEGGKDALRMRYKKMLEDLE